MKKSTTLVLLGSAVLAGYLAGRDTTPTPDPNTEIVYVTPDAIRDSLDDLRLESDGLRARLENVETREPRTIIRTDTVVRIERDTVYEIIRVDDGRLSFGLLARRDSLWSPEIHRDIDVSDCDEGFSIADGEVACDRARLGHLYVGGNVGLRSWLGAYWTPSYRSRWIVHVGHTGESWTAGVMGGFNVW